MPNAGYPEARRAMAEKTSLEQGTDVPPDSVIMSVGAAGAMNSVIKALVNSGDEIIVPCPYFAEYDHYIHNHGAEIHRVRTKNDFNLDLEAIKNALSEKTAAIIINSPNNPSGKIYSEDDIKNYLPFCLILERKAAVIHISSQMNLTARLSTAEKSISCISILQ